MRAGGARRSAPGRSRASRPRRSPAVAARCASGAINACSPKISPTPRTRSVATSPSRVVTRMATCPFATTCTASPGSPSWKITSPREAAPGGRREHTASRLVGELVEHPRPVRHGTRVSSRRTTRAGGARVPCPVRRRRARRRATYPARVATTERGSVGGSVSSGSSRRTCTNAWRMSSLPARGAMPSRLANSARLNTRSSDGSVANNGRGAEAQVEQRDLAERGAGTEPVEGPSPAGDRDLARDQDEELRARLALTDEHPTRGDLDPSRHAVDPPQLPLGAGAEHRQRPERVDRVLRRRLHTSHRDPPRSASRGHRAPTRGPRLPGPRPPVCLRRHTPRYGGGEVRGPAGRHRSGS